MENWKIRIRCLCSRFRRVRHRNGYGVHSPFAYNFIKSVVYERGQYYAYPALAAARRKAAGVERELTPRCHRLLFRVANFVHPASAAVVSPHGALSAAYIQAGSVHAAVTVADAPESLKEGDYQFYYAAPRVDFSVVWERAAASPATQAMVCSGIRSSRGAREAWAAICADERAVVTFDLYELGIVFLDKNLNKQNYIVSF